MTLNERAHQRATIPSKAMPVQDREIVKFMRRHQGIIIARCEVGNDAPRKARYACLGEEIDRSAHARRDPLEASPDGQRSQCINITAHAFLGLGGKGKQQLGHRSRAAPPRLERCLPP